MPGYIRDLRNRRTQPYTGPNPYQARWRHPFDLKIRTERSFATERDANGWIAAMNAQASDGPPQGYDEFLFVNLAKCKQSERDFAEDIEWLVPNIVLMRNGWPDFMCLPFGGRPFAVEVKTEGQKLTLEQLRMHQILRMLGVQVYVYREGDFQPELNIANQPHGRRHDWWNEIA